MREREGSELKNVAEESGEDEGGDDDLKCLARGEEE